MGGRAGGGTGPSGAPDADWFAMWERSVGKWWDAVIEDPVFVRGMSEQLAGTAELRKEWEKGVDDTMHRMHLPAKSDVVRIARVASLLEDRLVGLEDRVADTVVRLERIEKELLKARVDAATALVELRELLTRISHQLPPPASGGADR